MQLCTEPNRGHIGSRRIARGAGRNVEEYPGRTLRCEGILQYHAFADTCETFYCVMRRGPGRCGHDADAGFEVVWNGEYPAAGA